MSTELQRVNKITVTAVGEGVLQASLYRTHTKLGVLRSDDESVLEAGFVMPEGQAAIAPDEENGIEGQEAVKVTPSEKSEAFRTFVQENAATFGFNYDPVDRRSDENKFPSKYENGEAVSSWARKVVDMKMATIAESMQKQIDKLVEKELLPVGCTMVYTIGDNIVTEVTESYSKGNVKYAQSSVDVEIGLEDVDGVAVLEAVPVFVRSGCMAKPKVLGQDAEGEDIGFTTTAVKNVLIEAGIMPVIPKKVKEEVAEGEEVEATEPAEESAE